MKVASLVFSRITWVRVKGICMLLSNHTGDGIIPIPFVATEEKALPSLLPAAVFLKGISENER